MPARQPSSFFHTKTRRRDKGTKGPWSSWLPFCFVPSCGMTPSGLLRRCAPRNDVQVPVTRLALTDFRSYPSALIEPGPGFVLLFGENGAGKTNLLEAVSLLTPGRGLRGAALSEMARQGGNGAFAVSGRVDEADIGTGTVATAPERRQVRINGAPASVNSL